MKYCGNCGNPVDENAIFCPRCGGRTNGDKGEKVNYGGYGSFGGFDPYGTYPVYDMQESKGVTAVSFCFIEIGLILWFLFRRTRPGKSRSALKGVLGRLSFGMPVLGAVLWLLWKDEYDRGDFAKMAGISAIVGGAVLALTFIVAILVGF